MKLRVKGNTIRLRLSQSEITEFIERGEVEDFTLMDMINHNGLTYKLIRSSLYDEVYPLFEQNSLCIMVPESVSDEWVNTEMVGFNHELKASNGEQLHILVEKDFQCLHKRPDEDESDNFPNPLAG